MKFAVAQINVRIGDFFFNKRKITDAVQWAKMQNADYLLFPNCVLSGFPYYDLSHYHDFINNQTQILDEIAVESTGLQIFMSICNEKNVETYILKNGIKTAVQKFCTENTNIHLLATEEPQVYNDIHEISIQMGASKFNHEATDNRQTIVKKSNAQYTFFINHIGAQAGDIFDGNSLIFDKTNNILHELPRFSETYALFDTENPEYISLHKIDHAVCFSSDEKIALIHQALVLGIRDFFEKQSFKKAILGLSGGLDSAVVAALAVEALGAENVWGILLPSQYSSDHSIKDAKDLAKNLGCPHDIIPIYPSFTTVYNSLDPIFQGEPFNVAEENMQSRLRAVILMALSNKFGHILVNTSNKSELAVGYGTLYGDSCGAISILGDLYKTQVFALAHYINCEREIIPNNTIAKPPSAELRPDQKDCDSLPEYDILDAILFHHIEEELDAGEIAAKGFNKELIVRILKMVSNNEFKRHQVPSVLQVSSKSFGNIRKIPLTSLWMRR